MTVFIFCALAGGLAALAVVPLLRGLPSARTGATRALGFAVMLGVPAAALSLYMALGRPDLTAWRTRPAMPPFIASAVEKLKSDAAAHPGDAQAWVLLGGVYGKVRRYADAADAYRHALTLAPGDATLKAMLGETLVQEQGGAVTGEALALFRESSGEPDSKYYLALARSQAGDWPGAMAAWQALAAESPADAPWIPATQARLAEARRATGLDRDR